MRDDHRGVWLALVLLAAVIVGLVAGLLSWAGGMNPPTAVLAGGTALLLLAVLQFVTRQPS